MAARAKTSCKRNFRAVDETVGAVAGSRHPRSRQQHLGPPAAHPGQCAGVRSHVTGMMMDGLGDDIPVSAMPIDGTFPSGTAAWEKRNIAEQVPVWEQDLCIQCGQCALCLPAQRHPRQILRRGCKLAHAPPASSRRRSTRAGIRMCASPCNSTWRIAPAAAFASNLPALQPAEPERPRQSTSRTRRRMLETEPEQRSPSSTRLPVNDRARVDFADVRGVQFLEPLFEFSGACAGCGETPYLKLLSQLFGDRLLIANATGCSSIYGGNLPVTPWTKNSEPAAARPGRIRCSRTTPSSASASASPPTSIASRPNVCCAELAPASGRGSGPPILDGAAGTRVGNPRSARASMSLTLAPRGSTMTDGQATCLSVVDHLVRRSVWIVGGDGWAYDIGYGGLDHVLSSTHATSMSSCSTPRSIPTPAARPRRPRRSGAVAKFAAAGKRIARKDLALQAIAYGNVYVAQVAMGANAQQTLLAFREAEAYPGPSLILAYSHCIAHGIDMQKGCSSRTSRTPAVIGRCSASTR
jgi:pyruvate-ferredoxin/flavodoxin oxidoreductase